MRKLLIGLMLGIFSLSTNATVTVTENSAGTTTITINGEAGQIGKENDYYGNKSYEYMAGISENDQTKIRNAKNIIIKGNINAVDIKTLVAKNANGGNWTLDHLDMEGASIDKITAEGNEWHTSSHTFLPNGTTLIACKTITLPMTQDKTVPAFFRACLGGPNNLPVIEKIIIPEGYTLIGESSFRNLPNLTSVTLPNTLTEIKDHAFEECAKLDVMVFPESLRKLGNKVFFNTKLKDVYFLGKEAPVVGDEAFDEGSYRGYGGMVMTSDAKPYGNTDHGYAERMNFVDDARTFAVLHLRVDLTDEERAKYIDITRNYEVIKGDDNKYRAFYDLYYGKNMIWPGQYSYNHTFEDAVKGVLWDGKTTYDKTKYMGLHKFTIALSNVYNNDTKKWTFNKLSPNKWWTICVPFKMTKAQIREVFGEGTEVCKFSKVIRNKNKGTIVLEFKDDRMAAAAKNDDIVIQKHISYMIFPTKQPSGAKYVFDGYQIETGSPEPTSVKPEGSDDNEYTYRFIGTYLSRKVAGENGGKEQSIIMPQYSYFLGAKNGKHKFFYQTGTSGKWNPFTAVVQVFKGQNHNGIDDSFVASGGSKMMSFFGSDKTTDINTVTIELGNGKNATTIVYNLNGQVVGYGIDSLNELPGGIYIVNGKKVFNK
ncbi:MAG: leucine-rich repeat protein [Prevotella sp.]|nr:leucine-rich repeat protein [Prevotellaceae bacterium]MDY3936734.1 leucine-rich repeat protein [Prevotella sp.]